MCVQGGGACRLVCLPATHQRTQRDAPGSHPPPAHTLVTHSSSAVSVVLPHLLLLLLLLLPRSQRRQAALPLTNDDGPRPPPEPPTRTHPCAGTQPARVSGGAPARGQRTRALCTPPQGRRLRGGRCGRVGGRMAVRRRVGTTPGRGARLWCSTHLPKPPAQAPPTRADLGVRVGAAADAAHSDDGEAALGKAIHVTQHLGGRVHKRGARQPPCLHKQARQGRARVGGQGGRDQTA